MALLLEWWVLVAPFRWIFVKQDCRIREILELKSTTETCKSILFAYIVSQFVSVFSHYILQTTQKHLNYSLVGVVFVLQ